MTSDMEAAWAIFLHFAVLSLMAIGGGVLVLAPEMLRFVSDTHSWIDARTFVECFTLAQVAPGPNFLFATLVGMKAAGPWGALAATLALVGPPAVLTMVSLSVGARIRWGSWGRTIRGAVLPLSIGMVCATAWSLGAMAVQSLPQVAFFAVALLMLVRTRTNPLWLVGLGAVAGLAGWV